MATATIGEETALVPQAGESEADFSWRVHQALAGEMGTDQAQELAFQVWDEVHGEHPLLETAQRQFQPDRFTRTHWNPLFSEHTTTSQKTVRGADGKPKLEKQTTIYDRNALQAIHDRCNHRIEDTGDFSPITEGHTPNPDAVDRGAKQPDVLGYSGPYRMGLIGNKDPRWAIFSTEWHDNDFRDKLARLKRRSPEVWCEEKMADRFFDPIAALGAETPRLDMGLGRYGRLWARRADGSRVEKYAATFPGAGSAFIPGTNWAAGSGKKKNAAEGQPSMITPEDIDQIVAAISETDVWKWAQSQMPEGPDPSGAAPPEGDGMPPHAPAPAGAAAAPPAAAAAAPPEDPTKDWPEHEKKHYACMSEPMKEDYMAFRKKYTADGSAVDESVIKKDREGNVIDSSLQKNARDTEIVARYQRTERELADVRKELASLRKDRDSANFRAKQAERYSKLQARSREFVFDLAAEWERVSDLDDKAFERHVDGTIVANYERMPIGLELPDERVTGTVAAPNAVMTQRNAIRQKDLAVKIATSQKIPYRKAWDEAGKEMGADAVPFLTD